MKSDLAEMIRTMKRKLNKAIEEYLNLLRGKYGDAIQSVVLFGSAARGEMQKESDADVLIVVFGANARTRDAISMAAYEIMVKNDVVLSPIVMDAAVFGWYRSNGDPFYKNIRKDGVEIWTKRPERLLKSA
jgi:predicted nucleotidyltransferase